MEIMIVVTHEDDQSDEFDFDPGQSVISIGRRSTNDVCVPNLSVSGRHARIVLSDGEAWVEDLNSTNGTYINNRLISRQTLNHNDELVIGKTRLRFQNANARRTLADANYENSANAIPTVDSESPELSVPDFVKDSAPMPATQSPAAVRAASSEAVFSSLADELSENQPATHDAVANPVTERAAPAMPAAASASALDDLDASNLDDDSSLSLTEKAKLALERSNTPRPQLAAVNGAINGNPAQTRGGGTTAAVGATAGAVVSAGAAAVARQRSQVATATATVEDDVAVNEAPAPQQQPSPAVPPAAQPQKQTKHEGAVIEIKNGAKSGQILPIDKPVTTLGRPGIQIAAIMRKPDGYFLMHIESDDSVDRPTLNNDAIGDQPMLLQSGDELNVAGIDVEFMLS